MSQRKSRAPSDDDSSPGPRVPRVPQPRGRHSDEEPRSPQKRRRRSRYGSARGYDMGREKPSSKIDILLCVFHGAPSHRWRTAPYTFDRRKMNDREVWEDLQDLYRTDLQKWWRRVLLFKKLKSITPVSYTPNGVPIPSKDKDDPNPHSFMHAFHHPDHIAPAHEWIDWFTDFKADNPRKTVGLEFTEGLWAEKIALLAIIITIAIIVVSIVWALRGGQLQTVFTVMSFVLSGAAAEIALLALYYQVTLSN